MVSLFLKQFYIATIKIGEIMHPILSNVCNNEIPNPLNNKNYFL